MRPNFVRIVYELSLYWPYGSTYGFSYFPLDVHYPLTKQSKSAQHAYGKAMQLKGTGAWCECIQRVSSSGATNYPHFYYPDEVTFFLSSTQYVCRGVADVKSNADSQA